MDTDISNVLLQQQPADFIDTICLNKGILLQDGFTSATITTANGEHLPVTLIISESANENDVSESFEEAVTVENGDVSNRSDNENITIENVEVEAEPQTVYAIHIADSMDSNIINYEETHDNDAGSEEKKNLSLDLSSDSDLIGDQFDAEISNTATRLEDFMDVVTTYKCKFCRFACPWKSGLMSHIRCCHVKERKRLDILKLEKSNTHDNVTKDDEEENFYDEDSLKTDSSDKETKIEDNKNEKCDDADEEKNDKDSVQETHIFLCGQCSEGFITLEACKEHMIKDHNLKLEQSEMKPLKKRGRPRSKHKKSTLNEDHSNGRESKRLSRPPKNLEDDYDYGVKRKPRKETLNEKVFRCTCNGCGHRFSTQSYLQYHYVCHSDDGKPFMCPDCKEEFDHWRGLAMHLWKEHSVDVDLHSCPDCGYKTYSYFKLDNHKKIHSEERAFICETCGKGFKQISQLRNHLVIHLDRKNLPEKRWYSKQICETCGRTFSDTKCLRKHEQAVHKKLKPYVCSFCGHLSARKAMLELHMRQHTGEKPFLCEHCDYRTGDHNSLRRHRMRHTGAKPYKCPHCPYACIQAISYKTHLKNKHPGMEGLFACPLCSFKSVSKENYVNHMSDHKCQNRTDSDRMHGDDMSSADIETPLYTVSNEKPSSEIHLPDNALQQLEGILPGNITAAQLIYSCLNAISQEGGPINLPPGITVNIPPTTTTAADGTQTITIQLPSAVQTEDEPYYFTIQQDGSSTLATTSEETTNYQSVSVDIEDGQNDIEQSILPDNDNEQLDSVNSESLVIAHIESFDESKTYSSEVVELNENAPCES